MVPASTRPAPPSNRANLSLAVGDGGSARGARIAAGPLSLTATPLLRPSPSRTLPGNGRPPRPRRANTARTLDTAPKSVAELVADAVDAVDAQDAGRRTSIGAASGASGAESSTSAGSVRRLSGDGVGGTAPGALADVEDAYSSESDPDRDEVDEDDEDEEDEEEGKGAGEEDEDEDEEDDGTKQGDDDDTLQDFVQSGRGGGGDGGTPGGAAKSAESDAADGSGSGSDGDGEPDGEGEDEVDRPRVPTHFTARDLMAQGRALCHVLVRLCNLRAIPSPKHKTVRLRRTVVPGGPSGIDDAPDGCRTPPMPAARSRLLLAAGGDLVALELLGVRARLYPGSWSEWSARATSGSP